MKSIISTLFIFMLTVAVWGQDIDDKIDNPEANVPMDNAERDSIMVDSGNAERMSQKRDTVKTTLPGFKVDGVSAVVGDYVILDSDVQKALQTIQEQSPGSEDVTQCEIMGKLLEDKLYAHQAIQDSVTVNDAQVRAYTQQQIEYFRTQLGSEKRMLDYYRKETLSDLEKELYDLNRNNQLASKMQEKVVETVEITPDEVREFFKKIPEGERPVLGVELEISQIVIEPEIPQSEIDKVKAELNSYRDDVLNGSSFAAKAVLWSQDPGSSKDGGLITLSRNEPYVKEFKDAAFSLEEDEVSEPFETDFGYHILMVEKIRGQRRDVRHILRIPNVTEETTEEALKTANRIRDRIIAGGITFAQAAQEFSDEKETRSDGGALINPQTGDRRFELTNVDPEIYDKVDDLKEGELSEVFNDPDRTGRKRFKIITVANRFEEHVADFAKDYVKIKELALRNKQIDAIREWQDEKITETYIKVNGKYRDCDYAGDWLKK